MPKPVYFPGLNALRFYAALSVVIVHVPLYTSLMGRVRIHAHPIDVLVLSGRDAVTLFFVLSGFLITYLLLIERERTGTVNVIAFYKRRALRIWPLYYAVVLLAYVALPLLMGWVYPQPSTHPAVLGSVLLLLPTLPYAFANHTLLLVSHLWSIGVEEQFYAVWPLVTKFTRRLPVILVGVIAIKWLALGGLHLRAFAYPDHVSGGLFFLIDITRFECMAIGGLGAYLVFTRHRLSYLLYRRFIQGVAWLLVLVAIVTPTVLWYVPVYDVAISLVFMVVVVNIATNPRSLVQLEHPTFAHLGNLSYGIYMLHPAVTYLLTFVAYAVGWNIGSLSFYAGVVLASMGAAALSYRYLERPFLRRKARFAVIPSGASPVVAPAMGD